MITSSYIEMNYHQTFSSVVSASHELNLLGDEKINQLLTDLSASALIHLPFLIDENQKDLARMDKNDPRYDRLQLTEQRIKDIAADILHVSKLPSPLGKILTYKTLPN